MFRWEIGSVGGSRKREAGRGSKGGGAGRG